MILIKEGTAERLKTELKKLQSVFGRGYNFSAVHLPERKVYGEHQKLLRGEVQNSVIIIYDHNEEAAVQTLYHEFIEAIFIVPALRQCYRVMQHQKKMLMQKEQMLMEKDEIIHELLMELKENVVDGIAMPMSRLCQANGEEAVNTERMPLAKTIRPEAGRANGDS